MKYYTINHIDNKMGSYESSIDEIDDNFDFNNDNDVNVQSFLRRFNLSFCLLFLFLRCPKIGICI